jgi:hypothetical protein
LRNLYKFYLVPFTAKLSTSQVVDGTDVEVDVYLKATTISFPLKELISTFPEFTNPAKLAKSVSSAGLVLVQLVVETEPV